MSAMSSNGVQPEGLNDAELRVYELAKQTMPLAEIAVRLGVPIGEAERRIEGVCARLGVGGRSALQEGVRAAGSEGESIGAQEHRNAGAQDEGSEPPKTGGHRISRRAVLIGGGVAAGLAAGGGVAALLLRGDGDAPAAAGTPTAVVPTATPAASDVWAKIEPAPDAWEQRAFAPAELVDWPEGIFFMDVESGAIEGWRVGDAFAGPDEQMLGYMYRASGDLIWTTGNERGFVHHRRSERGWSWPARELRLVMAIGEDLLIEELEPFASSTTGPGQESGRYRVLRMADLREKAEFSLPAPWNVPQPQFDEKSQRLLIWSGGREDEPQVLHLLDAGTWKELASLALPPPVERWVPYTAEMTLLPGRGLLVQRVSYHEPGAPPKPSVPQPPDLAFVLPLSGDWTQPAGHPIGTERVSAWSPNTPVRVIERYARFSGGGGGEGGGERWPVLAVESDSGPLFTLLSASLLYSDVEFVRWLADGSGFTAMVDNGATEGNGWERIAFAVVSAADGKVSRFELPPGAGKEWYQSVYNRGPVPHPSNPDLFSFGRLELHNRKTGKWFRANISGNVGPGHAYPWSGRENEMVFSRPHGGHGGWGIPALIAPKVVQQIPNEPLVFRVARAGDCLNLREEPSTSAKVLDCLPDGTVLTLLDLPANENGVRPPSMARNDEGAWVYVQVSGVKDGKKGWVSSAYVDWA